MRMSEIWLPVLSEFQNALNYYQFIVHEHIGKENFVE